MNRFESKEDYLERIFVLSQNNKIVRAIDIANDMNYSKPSVSIALKKLKNEGYITVCEKTGNVSLTEKGIEVANMVYNRHEVIATMLVKIGVPLEIAKEDACKIEHDISNETYLKLKEFIEK